MDTLNITKAIKKMSVNKIRDFILENYYKQIGFSKETDYSVKRLEKRIIVACEEINRKISDPLNAKKHYQSFIRKEKIKSIKHWEIITYQPKAFENPNIVDIKSVITEHPKDSHKLPKTIRQAQKVGSNSSLYSDIKKEKIF